MRTLAMHIGVWTLVGLLAGQHPPGVRTDPADAGALTGAEIFAQVERANVIRDAELRAYESTRRYTVLEPGHAPDAELVVSMRFVAPSSKTFGKTSEQGVGWIQKRVFHGLMNAESEASSGKEKADSALSPANYTAQLIGDDHYGGRDCYVLSLQPKRQDKYVLIGKVWIDKGDFAIAKVEGDPVKSPSFWIERAHFTREYQRIGKFWLPALDQTQCRIRLVGEYTLRIKYFDYKVTPRE